MEKFSCDILGVHIDLDRDEAPHGFPSLPIVHKARSVGFHANKRALRKTLVVLADQTTSRSSGLMQIDMCQAKKMRKSVLSEPKMHTSGTPSESNPFLI